MTRRTPMPSAGPSQRQLRVGETIRRALADILYRGGVHADVLTEVPVTITEVRPSPDLRQATVFFAPLGGQREAEVKAALTQARPYLRAQVARAVRLRFAPDLSFQPDRSFDAAGKIDAILRSPKVAADLRTEHSSDDD